MNFIAVTREYVISVAELALMLWPEHTLDDLICEFKKIIEDKNSQVFLACNKGKFVGFVHCSLRFDYVEGTNSSPVGYLEGIFVKEEYRSKGVGKELLNHCEKWAKMKGAMEFASDCELTNLDSLRFHLNIGFREANRIICFVKELEVEE